MIKLCACPSVAREGGRPGGVAELLEVSGLALIIMDTISVPFLPCILTEGKARVPEFDKKKCNKKKTE